MLQTSQLDQFRRPHRLDVAVLPRCRNYRAGDQILVCVGDLVILKAEEGKEVDILFNKRH